MGVRTSHHQVGERVAVGRSDVLAVGILRGVAPVGGEIGRRQIGVGESHLRVHCE